MSYVMTPQWFLALIGLGFGALACGSANRADPTRSATTATPTSAPAATVGVRADTARGAEPIPAFGPIPIDSGSQFRQLVRDLGPDRLTLLLKLNRLDQEHLRAGDTLFLPTDSTRSELDLAPFPSRVPSIDSLPKALVVSQRVQAFAAYELGTLVRWGPTSTGKRSTPTPNGWFHTNWKAKETRSTENDEWLLRWYFNIENRRGVSLHEYALPGHPASHACIRLLSIDAEWIYRWADQWRVSTDGRSVLSNGTPVLIFGEYAWDSIPPWRSLGASPAAATVSESELRSAIGSVPRS